MWAFITESYKSIISTQRELDFLIGLYPFARWKRVDSKEDAKKFFNENERKFFKFKDIYVGHKHKVGYIKIEYFIDGQNIYANVFTKHFGYIKIPDLPRNVIQECTYDMIRLKVCNVILDDRLIAHHCIAITNIVRLFDPYINMEIVLPDISVYLALTKYTGNNYNIKKIKNELNGRDGDIYWTIKGEA